MQRIRDAFLQYNSDSNKVAFVAGQHCYLLGCFMVFPDTRFFFSVMPTISFSHRQRRRAKCIQFSRICMTLGMACGELFVSGIYTHIYVRRARMCARHSGSPTISKLFNVVHTHECTNYNTKYLWPPGLPAPSVLPQASKLISAEFQIRMVNGFTEFTTYRDISIEIASGPATSRASHPN